MPADVAAVAPAPPGAPAKEELDLETIDYDLDFTDLGELDE